MQRSWAKRLGYGACHFLARLFGALLFQIRVTGREKLPKSGGGLICANHQSYFDPVIVGLAIDRRLNFLARATLFANPLFGAFLAFLDTIPLDRDRSGFAGLKETLRCLKNQELVLIFPEGRRTGDGQLQPLKPGFCAVARRGRQPIVPIAFDGAFQAWPRTQFLPGIATIRVVVGDPIEPELIEKLDDLTLIAELERRLRDCFAVARAWQQHTPLEIVVLSARS